MMRESITGTGGPALLRNKDYVEVAVLVVFPKGSPFKGGLPGVKIVPRDPSARVQEISSGLLDNSFYTVLKKAQTYDLYVTTRFSGRTLGNLGSFYVEPQGPQQRKHVFEYVAAPDYVELAGLIVFPKGNPFPGAIPALKIVPRDPSTDQEGDIRAHTELNRDNSFHTELKKGQTYDLYVTTSWGDRTLGNLGSFYVEPQGPLQRKHVFEYVSAPAGSDRPESKGESPRPKPPREWTPR